jgi:hypothetical protein
MTPEKQASFDQISAMLARQPQVQQPAPGQVPAQGGKAQNPDGTYTGTLPGYAQPYVNSMMDQPQVQQRAPGQVPAQGGKGTSQQDYDRMMAQSSFSGAPPTYEEFVQNRLNPKPMPQVMPQKPGVPSQLGLNLGSMLYGGGGQQLAPGQVAPTQAEIDRLRPMLTTPMAQTPSNLPSYAQPAYNDLMAQKLADRPEIQAAYAPQALPPQVQQSGQAGADQLRALYAAQAGLNASRPQVQQPAPVMPRPAMPRLTRPTMPRPSSIGAGLAALRGRR